VNDIQKALAYLTKVPVEEIRHVTIMARHEDIAVVHYFHKGKKRVVDLDFSKQYMKMFIGDTDGDPIPQDA
jgi:hypothetical protein